jgi:hypothetical protein
MQMMMKQFFPGARGFKFSKISRFSYQECDYARPLSNTSIKTPGRVRVLAKEVGGFANHQSMRGRYGKLGRLPKQQLSRTFEELGACISNFEQVFFLLK